MQDHFIMIIMKISRQIFKKLYGGNLSYACFASNSAMR